MGARCGHCPGVPGTQGEAGPWVGEWEVRSELGTGPALSVHTAYCPQKGEGDDEGQSQGALLGSG